MVLMNKPLLDIDLDDINELKDLKVPEGAWIDYKQTVEHIDKIAKLLSAFANGQGGTVIIGVKEEKLDNGAGIIVAMPGISDAGSLESRIKGSCLNNVTPPIVPEFQPISLNTTDEQGRDLRLLVIRVSESDLTPHQFKDGAVYIRFWDRAHYENDAVPASLKEIGWLSDKRKNSVELKEQLVQRAINRALIPSMCSSGPVTMTVMDISIIPTFPIKTLFNYAKLIDMYKKSKANTKVYTLKSASSFKTASESLCWEFENEFKNKCYFEVNTKGLHYFASPVLKTSEGPLFIRGDYCFGVILALLDLAKKSYESVGFNGSIEVVVRFSALNNYTFNCTITSDNGSETKEFSRSLDANFTIRNDFNLSAHDVVSIFEIIGEQIMWSLGAGGDEMKSEDFEKTAHHLNKVLGLSLAI